MKKLNDVNQIKYSNWSDLLKSEHKNYWKDVSNLANMLGCLLSDSLFSIHVTQVKEKFGRVRAYVVLSEPKKVKRLYREKLKSIDLRNEGIKVAKALPVDDRNFWQKNLINTVDIQKISLKDFSKECLLADMQFYRSTYYDLVSLVPHYRSVLFDDADHAELLLNDKDELDEYLKKNASFYKNDKDYLALLQKVYEK